MTYILFDQLGREGPFEVRGDPGLQQELNRPADLHDELTELEDRLRRRIPPGARVLGTEEERCLVGTATSDQVSAMRERAAEIRRQLEQGLAPGLGQIAASS